MNPYIEIEFLDELDQNERFFRFGTDAFGMVVQIENKRNASSRGMTSGVTANTT
jgi:hypothetical protein